MRFDTEASTAPIKLGARIQEGVDIMETIFADRFYWARQRAGMGATTIAQKIGCSQGLISSIERKAAEQSGYTDAFARLFNVDAKWLRTGEGDAPEGFDPAIARQARIKGLTIKQGKIVPFRRVKWSEDSQDNVPAALRPESDAPDHATALQIKIVSAFQEFMMVAGHTRTDGLLDILSRLRLLVSAKKSDRDDEKGSAH